MSYAVWPDLTPVAWLHADGAFLTSIALFDEASGASAAPTACTYRLIGPDGADVIASTAATVSGGTCSYTATLSSATVGGGYVEVWTPTYKDGAGSGPPSIHRAAYVSSAPMVPMVTTVAVERHMPDFAGSYPGGELGFASQILSAWHELSARVVQETPAGRESSLWTPDALAQCHLWLSMAHVYDAYATLIPGEDYDAKAVQARAKYDETWRRLLLDLDTDGDGVREEMPQRPSGEAWPPVLGRVG